MLGSPAKLMLRSIEMSELLISAFISFMLSSNSGRVTSVRSSRIRDIKTRSLFRLYSVVCPSGSVSANPVFTSALQCRRAVGSLTRARSAISAADCPSWVCSTISYTRSNGVVSSFHSALTCSLTSSHVSVILDATNCSIK